MATEALTIRGIKKSFPNFKLGPVDITVPKGAIYGLIGPNGAGKTTTIDLVMGMGREDAGTVHVFGLDHNKEEVASKRQTGYVSPDLLFNAWGKVSRLINFVRRFYPDWDDAYCRDLLDRFKIGWDERISTLSFGSRTKLGLVVALSHRPALLLLDEPQAGLDAVSKRELFTELLAAVQDEDHTVLISSHNLDDIERFTDVVGIINNGKMLLEGSTRDLLDRYCLVDCTLPENKQPSEVGPSSSSAALPGVHLVLQKANRSRFLADLSQDAVNRLKSHGATDITTTPVTLEELFIALVKGN